MSYIRWLRSRIGRQKTILVYSTVVVQDDEGRILLQRRSDFSWWGLPGGILEPGEDIISCARRELREETGLEVGDLRLVGVYTDPAFDVVYPNGDETQQFSVCFAARVTGGVPQPDGEEILSLEFRRADDLAGISIPMWYRAMIRHSLEGTEPAFEWAAGMTPVPPLTTTQMALWSEAGYILPTAVAVVRRPDGRIYFPTGDQGQRHWPLTPMLLGETVAAAAVRSVETYAGATIPERLLGVLSRRSGLSRCDGSPAQMVAAVFLLAGANDLDRPSSPNWFLPEDLPSEAGLAEVTLAGLVVRALAGGWFVDDQERREEGPRV